MKRGFIMLFALAMTLFAGVTWAENPPTEAWTVSGQFSTIAVSPDGSVYGIYQGDGYQYSKYRYGYSLVAEKYDTDGNMEWHVAHPGFDPGHDLYHYPAEAVVDRLGNLHVDWWEGCWAWFHSNTDVATYDPAGNLIRQKRYWITNWTHPYSLAVDNDGGWYISGHYRTGGWGIPIQFPLFISKFDSAGNLVKQINPSVGSAWGSDLAVDADRNVYMTSGGYTVKYDAGLDQVWVVEVNGAKIAVDAAGDVYVVGGGALIKLDGDGNILWTVDAPASNLTLDSSGNVYVVGPSATSKYDPDGNQRWSLDAGGSTIGVDADENVYICNGGIRKFLANTPPVADAGTPRTVELASCEGSPVTLDGTASYDPDEDPITHVWSWNGGTATGPSPTVTLPFGDTTVTLTVTDDQGESSTATVTISVTDTTPPQLSISVDPGLWPPNHKLVDVVPSVSVSDACPEWVEVELASVVGTEPDRGTRSGDKPGDIVVQDGTLKLRAERAGTGDGRSYTVTYLGTDIGGNSSQGSATVLVPHDMR